MRGGTGEEVDRGWCLAAGKGGGGSGAGRRGNGGGSGRSGSGGVRVLRYRVSVKEARE